MCYRYPTDPQTYGIDEQFLWGSSVLISPALHEVFVNLSFLLKTNTTVWWHQDLRKIGLAAGPPLSSMVGPQTSWVNYITLHRALKGMGLKSVQFTSCILYATDSISNK